jgi:GTP cyclohydrolase II
MKISSEYNIKTMLKSRMKCLSDNQGNAIYLFGPVEMPIKLENEYHTFKWYTWLKDESLPNTSDSLLEKLPYMDLAKLQQSSILVYGDLERAQQAAVRIHSICHTGDIFGSQRCDCGSQLKLALQTITRYGAGALVYVSDHEGRGIGLFSKAMTYALQEEGMDTAEANRALGFKDDQRDYNDAALVLKYFCKSPITLLTNNPEKMDFLYNYGIKIEKVESVLGEISIYNRSYLETKVKVFNHSISLQE